MSIRARKGQFPPGLRSASRALRVPKYLDWLLRRATAIWRCLPNCQIVGAQKAGTSSLYNYLVQHPNIHASYRKEIHYFDGGLAPEVNTLDFGVKWYRAHFPLEATVKQGDICLDATPLYLFNPQVAKRIYECTPQAKIIILLRDPVERAISHYFLIKRHGLEELGIEQALAQEEQRLSRAYANNDFKDPAFRLYSYQARGMYLEQVRLYQRYFNDKQILIIDSEHLFKDTNNTLKQVFSFLQVDSAYQVSDLRSQNVGTNKTKVAPEVYEKLKANFEEPNLLLSGHINKKFDWQ